MTLTPFCPTRTISPRWIAREAFSDVEASRVVGENPAQMPSFPRLQATIRCLWSDEAPTPTAPFRLHKEEHRVFGKGTCSSSTQAALIYEPSIVLTADLINSKARNRIERVTLRMNASRCSSYSEPSTTANRCQTSNLHMSV
jgi:hypothetical protein